MKIPGFVDVSPKDANVYLSWMGQMILGLMAQADSVYKEHTDAVDRVAKALWRDSHPWDGTKTVWRGVMLDDPNIEDGSILPKFDEVPCFSYSEDKDIACWFADKGPRGFGVVGPKTLPPNGYVLRLDAGPRDVLFYWKWEQKYPAIQEAYRYFSPHEGFPRNQQEVTIKNTAGLKQFAYHFGPECMNYKTPYEKGVRP